MKRKTTKPKPRTKRGKKAKPNQCTVPLSVCRNPSCRYRFDFDDTSKVCRKCGEARRCERETEEGEEKCAIHGGKGREEGPKMAVPLHLARSFNRILSNPGLMSLAENQALIESRGDELNRMIEDADSRGSHLRILHLVYQMTALVDTMKATGVLDTAEVNRLAAELRRAIEPVRVEWTLWNEQMTVQDAIRRLNDTERKWALSEQANVPMPEVLEALTVHARLALKYIPDPADRKAYAQEMRSLMPSSGR